MIDVFSPRDPNRLATYIVRVVLGITLIGMMPGCSSTPSDRVDKLMADYRGDVPGASVLVVSDGVVLYRKAFGLADVDRAVPTTTATNYRLASITKQFTATAIMKLVHAGRLSYESSLVDVFPDFPEYGSQISISHVLSHTSGLLDYEEFVSDTASTQIRDAQILEMMRKQDSTYFVPGSAYRYSNTGYALLAMAVEEITGQPFPAFLEAQIFQPLEMDGSVAYVSGQSSVPNRAFGHAFEESEGAFVVRDQSPTSAVLGDGGVYSSIDDLLKWDQALYANTVLPSAVLSDAWSAKPNTVHDEGEEYGYGWYVNSYRGHRNLRHSGSTMGFRNDMERFPDERLTVIVLTNRNSPAVINLTRRIADIYLGD